MDLHLADKVVIVTGATANIGRAIALGFAAQGAKLVAVGRDQDAGNRLIGKAIEAGASEAIFVREDLLDKEAPARIVEAATKLGPVAALVNNVGGNVGAGLFVDTDPDTWLGDIDLNLLTVLRMTHAVLPGMIEQKAGKIVNIGSTAGIVGDYMLSLYSTAKAAVHGFTKILAKEVGQHGIHVNCIAPYGTVSKDPEAFSKGSRFHPESGFFQLLSESAKPEDREKMARKGSVLDRSIGTPEDIVGAALYLSSDCASFMTGQIVQIDGGMLL